MTVRVESPSSSHPAAHQGILDARGSPEKREVGKDLEPFTLKKEPNKGCGDVSFTGLCHITRSLPSRVYEGHQSVSVF